MSRFRRCLMQASADHRTTTPFRILHRFTLWVHRHPACSAPYSSLRARSTAMPLPAAKSANAGCIRMPINHCNTDWRQSKAHFLGWRHRRCLYGRSADDFPRGRACLLAFVAGPGVNVFCRIASVPAAGINPEARYQNAGLRLPDFFIFPERHRVVSAARQYFTGMLFHGLTASQNVPVKTEHRRSWGSPIACRSRSAFLV